MDQLISVLVSLQFVMLCLLIAGMVSIIRKTFEFFIITNLKSPHPKLVRGWEEWLLPILPVLIGLFIGIFIKQYPYPGDLGTQEFSRIACGGGAGLISTLLYRVIKNMVFSQFQNNTYQQFQSPQPQINIPITYNPYSSPQSPSAQKSQDPSQFTSNSN